MVKKMLSIIMVMFATVSFASRDGLVQYYSADQADASLAHILWSPVDQIGEPGMLKAINTGSFPDYYVHENGGGYEFSYILNPDDATQDGGSAIDLGDTFIPGALDDFSVEMWVRPDVIPAGNHQQTLWTTQAESSRGFRLYIFDWDASTGQFRVALEARDTLGTIQGQYANTSDSLYDFDQWHQIVAVYDANAVGDGEQFVMKIYVDGQLDSDTNVFGAYLDDLQVYHKAALGCNYISSSALGYSAANNRMYYGGGMALVRIYNKTLDDAQVAFNYDEDKAWIIDNLPYDPLVDPIYDPNVPVHDDLGLVIELDGRTPGNNPDPSVVWDSLVGGPGRLYDIAAADGIWPQYITGGGYEFSYVIPNPSNPTIDNAGGVIIIDDPYVPDWDDDVTIEVWFRNDEVPPLTNDQQVLFSTQSSGANGMRLAFTDTNHNGKYNYYFENRDNTGSKVNWRISSADSYTSVGQWHQLVTVYDARAYSNGVAPMISMYLDGVMIVSPYCTDGYIIPSDFNFLRSDAVMALGSCYPLNRTNYTAQGYRQYFKGGIALARVYSRVLSDVEIENNYELDRPWITDVDPYDETLADFSKVPDLAKCDLDDSRVINLVDFSIFAGGQDVDGNGQVNIDDLIMLASYWLDKF